MTKVTTFEPEMLLKGSAYPGACGPVELVETHMSWVFLNAAYAYKVKKPVRFEFADFSTLTRRAEFCHREIELNRRFAPELYLQVVAIVAADDGVRVCPVDQAAETSVIEWAVKMHRFPASRECGVMLEQGLLSTEHLYRFGRRLAAQHQALPIQTGAPISAAILENYRTLERLDVAELAELIRASRRVAERQLRQHSSLLAQRDEYVRPCHGDLHLGNLVCIEDEVIAFDCLEFNDALSTIDVWADVGFLFMDLGFRGRNDLAYAFLDGYLAVTGDYRGAELLDLFVTYRSGVRAKVAALRYAQTMERCYLDDVCSHLQWCLQRASRAPGRVIFTCGYSGSGKSYWSARLVSALPAIRIRSDVLRKASSGLASNADTGSKLGAGLYSADKSKETYGQLAALGVALALRGETVILDAACLLKNERETLISACQAQGVAHALVEFQASVATLQSRIVARTEAGADASEADLEVLAWQQQHAELPETSERPLVFNTEDGSLEDLIELLQVSGDIPRFAGS